MMHVHKNKNELYIYKDGQLVMKRWVNTRGKKTQPSVLFNINGWPNEQIY